MPDPDQLKTLKRLALSILWASLISPLCFANAAETAWTVGTVKKPGEPLRVSPDQKSQVIGKLPSVSKIWVTRQTKNGYRAVLLGKPVFGKRYAWLPENSVRLLPRAPASSPASSPLKPSESRAETEIENLPTYTGRRVSGNIGLTLNGVFQYAVNPNKAGNQTASAYTYGATVSPEISYLFGQNPYRSGVALALRGNLSYLLPIDLSSSSYSPATTSYQFPITWATQLIASFKNRSAFSPFLGASLAWLPLPYPSTSSSRTITYGTLGTSMVWLGAGLNSQVRLGGRNLGLMIGGFYAVSAISTPPDSTSHYQSPGWKISAQFLGQLFSGLSLQTDFEYLSLAGDLKLTGTSLNAGLNYTF